MKRNGKVELLRFIFMIAVLFYHLNKDYFDGNLVFELFGLKWSFFDHGRNGVEFFLLVTGWLTAKSVWSKQQQPTTVSVWQDTVSFLYKKIDSFFLPHILLMGVTIVAAFFIYADPFTYILDRLPSLLFLQRTGLSEASFASVEWYLASMLLALAVVYPLLKKWYEFTTLWLAPIGGSLLIGYLTMIHGNLPGDTSFYAVSYGCNLRAIAVLLMGVFAFRVSQYLRERPFTKAQKIGLCVLENVLWIVSLLYLVSTLRFKYEGYIVYTMAAALAITFSRDVTAPVYNNRLVAYLGRISLTVYLSQNLARRLVLAYGDGLNDVAKVLITTVASMAMGMLLDGLLVWRNKRRARKHAANP